MDFWELLKWCLGIIVAVITIYKFFWKAPADRGGKEPSSKTDSVASRFIALFESHGVHRNQIPDFFDHGITLHDCADETALLKKIDSQCLKDAAELFGVNLEWLQGASQEIYDIPRFYKDNEACEEYLTNLKASKPDANLATYVLTPNSFKDSRDYNNAVILITEVIGHINEREIYRYRLAGKTQNTYWKARAYFAVSCALLIKHGFEPIGQTVNEQWLISLNEGKTLIEYDFTEGGQHFVLPNSCVWYVDEFLECPDRYLSGVDPETDNFGYISALQMWLEFKHFMKVNDEVSYQQAQNAFVGKLKELS
ncbi:hypothetical protein L9W80_00070 [Vibrio aestuarianus]|uniref:hypothetical protein n=1 Tax=Vibrio aestuarianus TaxID=28171 RepID=UPI00237CE091|nr:hypothetical protein [Vibrio aestuarianus]MDE1348537.1 hypothetical protein [Vibrio aestuarianus]